MRDLTRKWMPVVILLLCAIVVFASIDRVPDPPATKPPHVAMHVSSLDLHLEAGSVHSSFCAMNLGVWIASAPLLAVEQYWTTIVPAYSGPLIRHAADASPPRLAV
jgi:hypothetical protein